MRLGVRGVELDGLSIKSLGVRQAISQRADMAQVVVSLGVTGIELDRRFVALSGFIVAPEALENLSQIVAADRRVGPQGYRALNEREGGFEAAGLQRDHAEQMQRVRVLRLELQYCSIAPFRFGQAAGSMMLERDGEISICALLWHRCWRSRAECFP